MKRSIAILMTALMMLFTSTALAADEGAPCILIKFSNDTRYKNIDSASVLSDLVIEKMLASGRFNLRESKPIDEDIAAQLYDNRVREISAVQYDIDHGNFTPLFEGPAFHFDQVQSLATSDVGQIISPSITSRIGKEHGAAYFIQGTIINMGQGVYLNKDVEEFENVMDTVGKLTGFGGFSMSVTEANLGVQTDLRIIEASTGRVIWKKTVTGMSTKSLTKFGAFKAGSSKLDSNMYSDAMEDAANKIVETITKDLTLYMLYNR